MHRHERWLPVILLPLLTVVGCEHSPTESVSDGEDAATLIVEAEWSSLPSLEGLLLETFEAVRSDPGGIGAGHLAEAGLLAADLAERSRPGEGMVTAFDPRVELRWAEAAIATLGEVSVDRTLDGAQGVVERLGDVPMTPSHRASVERAVTHLSRARAARAEGNMAEALVEGTRGADALRELSPGARAREVVKSALGFLARANNAAGPSPSDGISAALSRAERHCRTAEIALGDSDWRKAVREAVACGRIARAVLVRLAGEVPDDRLEERARAVIIQAEGYLARAIRHAGDDPSVPIADALGRARALLGEASSHLERGAYREAIRAALASWAISRRVLAGTHPGDSNLR